METLEGAVADLGTSSSPPPPRTHTLAEADVTLERLQRVGEVFLPAAHIYRDHCAKVGWLTALASLDKAGCAHMDALATRSVVVVTAEEVTAAYFRTRRSSNILLQDFWTPRGSEAVIASLREVQVQRARGEFQ